MARGRKPKLFDALLGRDEKHPLDVESSEDSETSVEADAFDISEEEIAEAAVLDAPIEVSGSPLGKVRGKDLKNY